eukprot:CAMPEP_0179434136 /NCGR_PEP_ID=MMETSP0799-20121207/18455_1 /TAXON_ID=46947 /ORGANISM="Geminigera cryophila, Strain CCMP2564" /LENGTH=115 /DNA_ID=CAMNT_0021212623 /DNA_START=132 /DNA_END=476 /DNA_ORIENTATION=-
MPNVGIPIVSVPFNDHSHHHRCLVADMLRTLGFATHVKRPETHEVSCDVAMNQDRIRQMFLKYDDDESGSIDGDELYWLLRDLGHLCTREETMRIISGMDVSGDGNVDFVEFIRW